MAGVDFSKIYSATYSSVSVSLIPLLVSQSPIFDSSL
jgi:hypothetical protein